MTSAAPLEDAILDLLDPRKGGEWSESCDGLLARLSERGVAIERRQLVQVLNRLRARRRVEAVRTEDRGTVYTRPEILLLAPGLAEVHRGTTARAERP